jgi:AmmeMemoRadiSam system protein B
MKASSIRKPAVAGTFYPDNPAKLREMISGFLKQAKPSNVVPKAVIAPHAGYIYSGPIAASAYARIKPARGIIKRVILLGPSHRVPFRGLAASGADAFATPLGNVPIDKKAVELIQDLPQVDILDTAHVMEHSLEVQLPFLQEVLGEFSLVPLAVGDASAEEVADVLERLWGGPETLIVISSDLSHYHDYRTAGRMDRATSDAIESLHPEDIEHEQACGRVPISGLLVAAKKHGLRAQTIDLRNSGDTAGSRDEVVGYGAYTFVSKPEG